MTPSAVRVNVMHASMQYSDTTAQQSADATKVFSYAAAAGVWWITGTEANQAEDSHNYAAAAKKLGFSYKRGRGDVWIAVDPTKGGKITTEWTEVIPGKAGSYPNRGILRCSFTNNRIGRVTALCCHYNLSGPKHPHAPGAKQNPVLAAEISKQAVKYGKGSALCWYGGDQNLHDERPGVDTFYGAPLTSAWDELNHYEPTHPGRETIDVIASYDRDGRVKAVYCHSLDDSKLKLHTDHFPVIAGYDVVPLRAK